MTALALEIGGELLPRQEHHTEEAAKQLARRLLLLTVKDAYDLWDYYRTGIYNARYRMQFGFTKNADKERAFKRHREQIQGWVNCEEFKNLCNKLNFNAAGAANCVQALLEGNETELQKVQLLLAELQEETQNYAYRGPRTTTADEKAARAAQAKSSRHAASTRH